MAVALWFVLAGPAMALAQPEQERAELLARAERNDAEAQNALGNAYTHGQLGLAPDSVEALRWYRRAAEQGHAPAQFNLGLAHELGRGVAKSETEAFRYYLLAAAQGFLAAQFNVGNMYATGRGTGEDPAQALIWHRRAAEQGLAEAQFNLGLAHESGRGVPRDDAEAARWYGLAAAQGFPLARYNLALLLEDGRGVAKDEAAAAAHYRAAAEAGVGFAQNNYGLMLYEGRGGLAADPAEAYFWLSLAAANGVSPRGRDTVGVALTPAQRKSVEQRLAQHLGRPPAASASGSSRPVEAPPSAPIRPAAPPAENTADLTREISALTAQLAAARAEITRLTESPSRPTGGPSAAAIARYEEEIAELGGRLERATSSLTALQQLNQQLAEDKRRLQRELVAAGANTFKSRFPVEGDGGAAGDSGLERENEKLRLEVQQLTRDVIFLRQQQQAAVRSGADQTGDRPSPPPAAPAPATPPETEPVVSADARVQARLLALERERNDLEQWVRLLESQLAERGSGAPPAAAPPTATADDSTARLRADLERAQAALTEARQREESLLALNRRLLDERGYLEARLQESAARLAAAGRDSSALPAGGAELASLRQANAQLQQERDDLSRLLDSYRNDFAQLRSAAPAAGGDERLRAAQAEIGRLHAAVSSLETRLQQAHQTLGELVANRLTAPPPSASESAPGAGPPPPGAASAAPSGRVHTVANGDSLSRISQAYYGTADRWWEIYEANRDQLRDGSTLRPGQRLRVP